MNRCNFDSPVDRSLTNSIKWNRDAIESICGNPQASPHWVADMDFPAPEAVSRLLHETADHGILGYPRFADIRETFIEWTAWRHNWQPEINTVVASPGMLTTLALLVEMLTSSTDAIIVPMPAYKPFVILANQLGRNLIPWPMVYDPDKAVFQLDLNALETLAAEHQGGVLLFCSPHNPSGRVFTREELATTAEIAARCHLTVLSDEIHADLVFPGVVHTPFDRVAREAGCSAVTCMAPSKTFNIAGEHFSVAVCSDPTLAKRLILRMHTLFMGTDLLATTVAIAAYRHGREWLQDLTVYLSAQAEHIDAVLKAQENRLRFVHPATSFIGFIDCSRIVPQIQALAQTEAHLVDQSLGKEGGMLSRFFGLHAGIAMNDGTWFGPAYGNFVRFNYGTQRSRVDQALNQIIQAVNRLFPNDQTPTL